MINDHTEMNNENSAEGQSRLNERLGMGAFKDKRCKCGKEAELNHIHNSQHNFWCWNCWNKEFKLLDTEGIIHSK